MKTKIPAAVLVGLFAAMFVGCGPGEPVSWPKGDPQLRARALISERFLTLLEPQLIENDGTHGGFHRAARMQSPHAVGLGLSPLDFMFDIQRVQSLCSSYRGLVGSAVTRATAAENLGHILDYLAGAHGDSLGDDSTNLSERPLVPTSPDAQQLRVLNDLDRARLFSTVFAIELLDKIEREVPAELYSDFASYHQLNDDILALGNAVSDANPVTDLDLIRPTIIAKQKKLVDSSLAFIKEFHQTHMGDAGKLSAFLALYGDQDFASVENLGKLMSKARTLASVNDKQFEPMSWITDPLVITDRVELMNQQLPAYFGGIDDTAARLRTDIAPVAAVSGRDARAARFCDVAQGEYDTLKSGLGQRAVTEPTDIADARSGKAVDLASLANQSALQGLGQQPAQ